MYESPINRVISDIQTELQNIDENNLMATVKQSIGYEVNKEELLKALDYDRRQYEKGYQDGKHEVLNNLQVYIQKFLSDYSTIDFGELQKIY